MFPQPPVQSVISWWIAILHSRHVTHLLLRTLAPVANATLDIVKVAVFRVIGHPCREDWVTMPDLPISTEGVKVLPVTLLFRATGQKVLHHMFQDVLNHASIVLPLSVSYFRWNLPHLNRNWQKSK
jgi:hypothetical protein